MATLFGVLFAHNTKNRPPLIAKGEIINIKDEHPQIAGSLIFNYLFLASHAANVSKL